MCESNEQNESTVWLEPPLVQHVVGDWELQQYDPTHHNAAPLIQEQEWAVQTKRAQMLPWNTHQGELKSVLGLPIFVATIDTTVIAASGYNALYTGLGATPVAELGGAYVGQNFRGKGIYKPTIEARVDFAKQAGLWLITFANSSSRATLEECGFVVAQSEEVPPEAFQYCLTCEFNPVKGQVPSQTTCCDGDDILVFNNAQPGIYQR